MAVTLHANYVEIFKFPETGWFALFEEVLEFRKQEQAKGIGYEVVSVGYDQWGNLSVRLSEVAQ
jgi:hypothetical protein